MSTTPQTVDFICAQSGLAQRITARKMFGEYALYVDGKVVALVCDDTLFVKPTPMGAALLGAVDLQPPYAGAKPHFCISEQLDDRELLQRVLLLTAEAMPTPKAKAKAPAKVKAPAKAKATAPAKAKAPANSKASAGTAAKTPARTATTVAATRPTAKTTTKSPVKKSPAKPSSTRRPTR
jgi:TfoX/Sxy family transcriptional regulator of competence genes